VDILGQKQVIKWMSKSIVTQLSCLNFKSIYLSPAASLIAQHVACTKSMKR